MGRREGLRSVVLAMMGRDEMRCDAHILGRLKTDSGRRWPRLGNCNLRGTRTIYVPGLDDGGPDW